MTILYPIHERLMLRKARDARIMRMAQAFAAQGHKIYLLVGKTGKREEEILRYYGVPSSEKLAIRQIPILRSQGRIRLTINEVFLWAALLQALRLRRTEPVQVLFFSVLEVADFFLKRRKYFPGVRFIYEMHELSIYPENSHPSPNQCQENNLEKKVLANMDGVFTTTEAIRKVVVERFPHLPSATIPLGMIPAEAAAPPFRGFGERVKICYAGQFYEAQGLDILLKALTFIPQTEAHLIGGTFAECATLKKMAVEEGVSTRVNFYGFVDPASVPRLIRDMDIFIVPAKNTVRMNYVAHIKIYEYMASQRPIVATRLRSIAEEIEDGQTGILVEPGDPQALAEGIRRLISQPALAQEIAQKAYERSQDYHWEKRVKRIVDFVQSIKPKGPIGVK
jgi:glycosyltransferase involved in cell wall biosynthesis